jgi:hypothetical protein
MDQEQLIKLTGYFVNSLDKDDEDLVQEMVRSGETLEIAERVVVFLPIAFSRVVISHMANVTFSEEFKVKETNQLGSLLNEPIYVEALKLACESYHSGTISGDVFTAIATRSHEIDAVNKALNASVDINGSKFSPVVIFGWRTFGKQSWFQKLKANLAFKRDALTRAP